MHRAVHLGPHEQRHRIIFRLVTLDLGLTATDPRDTTEGRQVEADLLPYQSRLVLSSGASLELRAREGKKPSCKAGCSHCCRQLVPVSVVEAKALALAVAKMPPKRREATRRRFAALLARLESEGIVQPSGGAPRTALVSREKGDASEMWAEVNRHYFSLHLDCPFLEQDRCTVYEERPFVCREYMVTSPATLCASMDPSLEAVPRPIYMTQAVARANLIMRETDPNRIAALLDDVHEAA